VSPPPPHLGCCTGPKLCGHLVQTQPQHTSGAGSQRGSVSQHFGTRAYLWLRNARSSVLITFVSHTCRGSYAYWGLYVSRGSQYKLLGERGSVPDGGRGIFLDPLGRTQPPVQWILGTFSGVNAAGTSC
jgi:NADPH-dependent ferric siderophore reductase